MSPRAGPPPFVLVEGPPGCARPHIDRARASGLQVVAGFRAPGGPGPWVCSGRVDGPDSAAQAVLAALDGAGLIVEVSADPATIDRLADDLRRLGPVDHRRAQPEAGAGLDAEARELLGLLAEGYSLGEAAHLLGLARRTADRRLASARAALGVARTTEAVARARRLGWLGSNDREATG